MIAIADTSFVLAVGNKKDSRHEVCTSVFKAHKIIYLPQSTLAEIAYMLGRAGGSGAVANFLFILPIMKYQMLPLTAEDFHRTAQILQKYIDTCIDFVDASVAAVAERLNITRILTLDQRDFSLIRPNHCAYFEWLPSN